MKNCTQEKSKTEQNIYSHPVSRDVTENDKPKTSLVSLKTKLDTFREPFRINKILIEESFFLIKKKKILQKLMKA